MEGSLVAYKVFTNGSVLNASEINDNLMNQSVMVFSNSTARSAALTSPLAGMVTFLEDTSSYESYDGAAWIGFGGGGSAILQLLSVTKTDVYTMSSTTFDPVTGLSIAITPSSTASKILVFGSVNISSTSGVNGVRFRLMRDSTAIALGDTASTRTRTYSGGNTIQAAMVSSAFNFLDSPSTVSSVTYKIELSTNSGGQVVAVNRQLADGDDPGTPRGVSTITVMEVAG
jgi:hypothetical protein